MALGDNLYQLLFLEACIYHHFDDAAFGKRFNSAAGYWVCDKNFRYGAHDEKGGLCLVSKASR
ncbi:MAG: hypothetical protein NTW91_06785 [Verrucomicrobia bacterium]|nr:hypothetical protein [Verrucomicrobiota bacterium]